MTTTITTIVRRTFITLHESGDSVVRCIIQPVSTIPSSMIRFTTVPVCTSPLAISIDGTDGTVGIALTTIGMDTAITTILSFMEGGVTASLIPTLVIARHPSLEEAMVTEVLDTEVLDTATAFTM